MTLIDLIVSYFGKPREVAGSPDSQNQCVDLANSYIRDVLGLPIIEWTDAKDFPSKAGDNYDFIANTPEGVPGFGDLVVWNGNIGSGHGHIAIALGGDTNTFVSFDENWSVSQRCTIERHNYDNVSGWLHPKQLVPTINVPSDTFTQLVSKSTAYDSFNSAGYASVADVKKTLDSLSMDLSNSQSQCTALEAQLKDLNDKLVLCQNQTPSTPPTVAYSEIVIANWHTGLYVINKPV